MTFPESLNTALCQHLETDISARTGDAFRMAACEAVGGGSINRTFRIEGGGRSFFLKLNDAAYSGMFTAEAEGLTAIARTATVRVPAPVCNGSEAGAAYLVMEYIPQTSPGVQAQAMLGEQLAAMHGNTADRFGWHRDNTIGSTPQYNDWRESWPSFYRSNRLKPQLDLAEDQGDTGKRLAERGRKLCDMLEVFLEQPPPSLLHGDLWGGNYAQDPAGRPLLFDPAVYHGDRETDIAMTELFGGFGPAFYDAYNAVWPLPGKYRVRKNLYNLYHLLNHFNLFGTAYAGQCRNSIEELLAQAGH